MLVLSRKVGEEVVIGDTIEVVVLKVAGGRVKLGVSCPRDVNIRRKELCRRQAHAQVQCRTRPAVAISE